MKRFTFSPPLPGSHRAKITDSFLIKNQEDKQTLELEITFTDPDDEDFGKIIKRFINLVHPNKTCEFFSRSEFLSIRNAIRKPCPQNHQEIRGIEFIMEIGDEGNVIEYQPLM